MLFIFAEIYCFKNKINLVLQNGNIFIEKTFSETLFLKAIIVRSCSFKIGVKIAKFTSNHKKKCFHLEDELK